MTEENVKVTISVDAPVDTVFDVLADASTHEAIDGTGWVREPLNEPHLTRVGQIFRIKMYHDNHPDKFYEMSNRVEVLDRPHAIAWKPGQGPDDGGNLVDSAELDFGGWFWRYDLEPVAGDRTDVTLTYDWSGVPKETREAIQFPPFEPAHLDNSLKHLAELVSTR
jgi:hypothetical protein